MRRRLGALGLAVALLSGLTTTAVGASAVGRARAGVAVDTASTAGPSCAPHLRAPTVVRGSGTLQVFGIQYFQRVAAMTTYASIADEINCYFATYVTPYRTPAIPGLVVWNELTGLLFALAGSRGAPARALATTPAATLLGKETGEPLGAIGGAVGSLGLTYGAPLAFYAAMFPGAVAAAVGSDVATIASGGVELPASFVFLAATDTYVRAFFDTFGAVARRYRVTVVAGAPMPILTSAPGCAANGYPGWAACPGWRSTTNPVAVAALADPDLHSTSVYEALVPTITNAQFVFGPDGRLEAVQPKVNLTATELELGWQPAPMSTVRAIPLRGGVRLGIAISLDAFEHGLTPAGDGPCASPASYVGCLASQGANLLLQPDFNDGTAACPSWSDFGAPCGPPEWQQLGWMLSSWYDVEARTHAGGWLYPSIRYAVNPFVVGNVYDISGDGQSAIFARSDPRATTGSYVGDGNAALYRTADAFTPYADPTSTDDGSSPLDPLSLAQLDGPQPGFLALAPWVLPASVRVRAAAGSTAVAGSPASLQSCTDGLVPGSGVTTGPCAENAELPTAVIAAISP